MSVSYTSILWNKQKKTYDIGIALFVLTFTILFFAGHAIVHPDATFETVFIRNFGLLAFVLLHIILVIGPLARIDNRFLIVLYNRRHLGVTMFLMALIHGSFSIVNFHALGDMNPVKSVFLSNLRYDSLYHFPFQTLGFLALVILALMATTSHDFWLKNIGPKVWKGLHMLVYVAYGLIIMHVVLGALQNESSPILFGGILFGFASVTALHLYTGFKEKAIDKNVVSDDYLPVCNANKILESRAKIITANGVRIAIFNNGGQLSAVNNFCRHQGGPLGEGKIVDGCITCPWHGYQYRPEDGQSPPPFTEKIETYNLKLVGDEVWVDPKPHAPGTYVEPLIIK